MRKFTIFLCYFLVLSFAFKANAQTTCTFTANTPSWLGGAHANLSCSGSGSPTTYIIPAGITVSTGTGSTMSGDVIFNVSGTLNLNLGDFTATNMTINVPTGGIYASNGGATYGDLTVNVTGGSATGGGRGAMAVNNLTFNVSSGTASLNATVSGTTSSTVTGGAATLNGTFNGPVTATVTGGTSTLLGTYNGNLTGTAEGTGKLIFKGTTATTSTATLESKSATSEVEIDGATFNGRTYVKATAGTVRVKGTTTFNEEVDIDVEATATMLVEGTLKATKKANVRVKGTLEVAGALDLDDPTSSIDISTGGTVKATLSTSRIKLGTKSEVGIRTHAGPKTITETSLPVELVSFKGAFNRSSKAIDLEWITASELNVARYELLRSTNNKDFSVIYTKGNISNSTTLQRYTFTDRTAPAAGIVYYQIRNVDLDGASQTSKTVAVTIQNRVATVKVFPNPAKNILNIETSLERGTVEVFNITGSKLLQTEINQEGSIDVSSFAKGIYVLRINDEVNVATQRFIVE